MWDLVTLRICVGGEEVTYARNSSRRLQTRVQLPIPSNMPRSYRETVFFPEADISSSLPNDCNSLADETGLESTARPLPRIPAPNERADTDAALLPQYSGSPWDHYNNKFSVRFWCLFGVVASKTASADVHMLRKVSYIKSYEQPHILKRLYHPNIVQNLAVFIRDTHHFIVSEFMPTSLLHLCSAPIYPSEPQLGSILHQVNQGIGHLRGPQT